MKKLFLIIAFAGAAWANQGVGGFCEQGNIAVQTSGLPSTNVVQGSFPSCTVTVFTAGTVTPITIFADNINTPLSNPFTANTSGRWLFYSANNQRVDIQLSGGGLPSPWTIKDVILNDPNGGVIVPSNFAGIRIVDGVTFTSNAAGINAADANLGATMGEVWIPSGALTATDAQISIRAGHTLRIFGSVTIDALNRGPVLLGGTSKIACSGNYGAANLLNVSAQAIPSMVRLTTQDGSLGSMAIESCRIDANGSTVTNGVIDASGATGGPSYVRENFITGLASGWGVFAQDIQSGALAGTNNVQIQNNRIVASGTGACIEILHSATNAVVLSQFDILDTNCTVGASSTSSVLVQNSSTTAADLRQVSIQNLFVTGTPAAQSSLVINGIQYGSAKNVTCIGGSPTNCVNIPSNANNLALSLDNLQCTGGCTNVLNDVANSTTISNNYAAHYDFVATLASYTGAYLPAVNSLKSTGPATFTGTNTFSTGTTTLSGPLVVTGTDSGTQTISGNKTFTGTNAFNTGTTSLSGPLVVTGTDTGTQTISGNKTISGTDTFSGANSFTNTNTFTGTANTFTVLNGCQHVNASQSFATALAVGGVTCIAIDQGTFTVSANATVPSSVSLQFSRGGLLSIATGVTLTVSGVIYGSPDAQLFVYVGTGTVTTQGNNGFVSSAWYPGADICAQINTAIKSLQAGSPGRGSVIDARYYASGNQACSSNMFAGVTIGGQLYLGIYTIQTTASQVTPTKFTIEGAGRGDSGNFGTVIQAVAGFPTTTVPVITWGAATVVGARWRNVTVDCNNITNAIGVQNLTAQEESGFSYGIIRDCPGGNLDVETTTTQNSGPWDNLEIAQTNLCTNCGASSFPAKFKNTTPSRGFKSSTVNTTGVGTPPTALVLIDSNAFSMEDINIENAPAGDGVLLGSQVGALGVTLKNISCFNLTNCVHVSVLQNAGPIAMFGISSTGSVTNLVKDDTTGRTATQAASPAGKLGWYIIGDANRGVTAPVFTDAIAVAAGTVTIPCQTLQKTETAADTNLLTCSIPAVAGSYRIRFVLSIGAASAATLGWTMTWTDSNGVAVTPTNMSSFASGQAAPALTFTTSSSGQLYGYADVDVNNAGTSIVVKLTFSGTSFTGKASATVERII